MKPIEHCETCQFCEKGTESKSVCNNTVNASVQEIADPKEMSCSVYEVADRFKPKQ